MTQKTAMEDQVDNYYLLRKKLDAAQSMLSYELEGIAAAILNTTCADVQIDPGHAQLRFVLGEDVGHSAAEWVEVWPTRCDVPAKLSVKLHGLHWDLPLAGVTAESAGQWATDIRKKRGAETLVQTFRDAIAERLPDWELVRKGGVT